MKTDNNNRPADIVKVDFHDWNGNLIDRIKARTNEKSKGALMLDRIKENFDLTDKEIQEMVELEKKKILEEDNKPIPFSKNWKSPRAWKKDF